MGYGMHGFLDERLYADPSVCYTDAGVCRDGYYTSGYYFYPKNCYPVLVKNALEERLGEKIDFRQCAINSMRALDLRYLLYDDASVDGYVEWRLGDGSEKSGWIYDLNRARYDELNVLGEEVVFDKDQTDLRAEFRSAIEDADLITYDLGVNDFGVYLANRLIDNNYSADFKDLGPKGGEIFYEARDLMKEKLLPLLGDALDTSTVEKIEFYLDTLAYAYAGFVIGFDDTMKLIYDVNPDCTVIVLSIQNLLEGMTLKLGDIELPFGDIFAGLLDLANTYTAVLSPYAGKYIYADVRQNGHVEYFADELMAWDGDPKTLSENMKDCFNAYDSDFLTSNKVREQVDAYCAANGIVKGSDDYNELLENSKLAAYCVMANAALCGIEQSQFTVGDIGDINMTKFNGQIKRLAWTDAVNKICSDKSLEDACAELADAVNALISTPESKTNVHLFMLAGYANCFFYHPTPTGHKQLAVAVLKAYDKGISGSRAFDNAVDALVKDIVDGSVKYGIEFVYSLIDEVAAKFGLSETAIGLLKAVLPDSEFTVQLLISLIGIDSVDGIEAIGKCVSNTEAGFVGRSHTLRHHAARPATFFSSGNVEYYVCSDCGKYYSDAQGLNEISPDSVKVDQLGIRDLVKYIIDLFSRLVSGFGVSNLAPRSFG